MYVASKRTVLLSTAQPITHSLSYWQTNSTRHSLTHSLTHIDWPIQPVTHSLTHLLTHYSTQLSKVTVVELLSTLKNTIKITTLGPWGSVINMSLAFTIFCGRCFRTISQTSQTGGSVLSCGDFLCSACAQSLISGSSCPACGKQGVRAVFLNDSLPEEVKHNISDSTKEMERLHSAMMFQTKYYKQLIKRLLARLQQSEQELHKRTT
jgi:hypothetical protein